MQALFEEVDAILTGADDPSLTEVVRSGERHLIEAWLNRKFDQWVEIRPYLIAGYQAAPTDPAVASSMEQWFEETTTAMQRGLDSAGRFDPSERRIRCVLAFGQFEYLARRWLQAGWLIDRAICLETITDSWCYLLTGPH
jgi:hypothetical protein